MYSMSCTLFMLMSMAYYTSITSESNAPIASRSSLSLMSKSRSGPRSLGKFSAISLLVLSFHLIILYCYDYSSKIIGAAVVIIAKTNATWCFRSVLFIAFVVLFVITGKKLIQLISMYSLAYIVFGCYCVIIMAVRTTIAIEVSSPVLFIVVVGF